jgi:hypothetical protein
MSLPIRVSNPPVAAALSVSRGAIADETCAVVLFDLPSGSSPARPVATIRFADALGAIALSSDGTNLVGINVERTKLSLRSVESGDELLSIETPTPRRQWVAATFCRRCAPDAVTR